MLGRLAQPVEQLTLNQRVAGSIPASPTSLSLCAAMSCFVLNFAGSHSVAYHAHELLGVKNFT